jgi:uncharacterized protein (TIGR04222 family)
MAQLVLPQMAGPAFLGWFALWVSLVWTLCFARLRSLDDSRDVGPPVPPPEPDPFELAWLRGGEAEVARAGLVSLLRKGQVILRPAKGGDPAWITSAGAPPAPGASPSFSLSPIEEALLAAVGDGAPPEQVLAGDAPAGILAGPCAEYRRRAEREALLSSEEMVSSGFATVLLAGGLVAGPGLARFLGGMAAGHSVLMLVAEIGIGLGALALLWKHMSRLSRRGRDYLAAVRSGYEAKRQRARTLPAEDPAWETLVALFGPNVLAEGAHAAALPALSFGAGPTATGGWGGGSGGCGGAGCGGCGGCGG